MRKRNWNRKFGIQRLEDRRLLAADVAVDLTFVDTAEPEICEVQCIDSQSEEQSEEQLESAAEELDSTQELDLDSTEIAIDNLDDVDSPIAESNIHNLGDPVDGTDGFFGSIDAETPSQTFNISPSEDGMVDIVIASSFGESETRLSVTDGSGDVVVSVASEQLDGFKQVSFEGDAGENYLLTVSSEPGTEGQFQVTVGHSEFVDQHADTIGESSTELTFSEGTSTLEGRIESAGDIDTFRFTADADGKATLGLAELEADNATELSVQVLNSEGEQVARGITNESVDISFDVEAGSEYFLSVNAAEGEIGSYRVDLSVEPTIVESTETESTEPSSELGETDTDIVVDITDESTEAPVATPGSEDELVEDSDTEVVNDTEAANDTEAEQEATETTEPVADPTEESDTAPVDEIDIDPIVESVPEVEVVDSTGKPTDTVSVEDEVITEAETEADDPSVEDVDEVDDFDNEETTVDDDPTSNSDSDPAAEVDAEVDPVVTIDPVGEGDSNEGLVGCDPIPVDVIDAESSEAVTSTEIAEVSDSTSETPAADLPESFELSEAETEDADPTSELEVIEAVEDLIDTVLDAADHAETLEDLLDDGVADFLSDHDGAEQAIDSFFSDADLVEDLIRL